MVKKWLNISKLAALVEGEWQGEEDVAVCALADIDEASEGQLAYLGRSQNIEAALTTGASALIISRDCTKPQLPVIIVDDPVLAAAVIHNHLLEKEFVAIGVHEQAVVGNDCTIPAEVSIGPMAVLGERVKLGKRVLISSGAVIGDDVRIGCDVKIYPNATILDRSVLGDRVVIHSGTVVGSDGFGYAHDQKGRPVKRPQVGYVQIDDDVEIGANSCIDRATFGRTWIKQGVKIDNLVHVSHNVEIGEYSIMAAQCGVAGSTVLGTGVVMGGHVAVSGHLKIGDRVTMAGRSGVASDQESGVVVAGFPAFAHRKWLRASAVFQKLPEMVKEIREIRKRMQEITEKIDNKRQQD